MYLLIRSAAISFVRSRAGKVNKGAIILNMWKHILLDGDSERDRGLPWSLHASLMVHDPAPWSFYLIFSVNI